MTKRGAHVFRSANDELTLDCQGTSSAVISVSGSFDGDIAVQASQIAFVFGYYEEPA